jgi:hypothetical protein
MFMRTLLNVTLYVYVIRYIKIDRNKYILANYTITVLDIEYWVSSVSNVQTLLPIVSLIWK